MQRLYVAARPWNDTDTMKSKLNRSISVYFLLLGFIYACWASRIPDLQRLAGLSDSGLGVALLGAAFGAFSAIFVTPRIIGRLSSKRTILLSCALFALSSVALAACTSGLALGALLFWLGVVSAILDIAINTQAVAAERESGRPIMSSLHGMFSLGVALGGGVAGIVGASPLVFHFSLVAVLSLALCAAFAGGLSPIDPPAAAAPGIASSSFLPTPLLRVLACVMFCALLTEGAVAEWSAKFMRDCAAASAVTAPFALAAFSVGMLVGRFRGDHFRGRYGDRAVVCFGAIVSAAAVTIALLVATPAAIVTLFTIVGLGLSTIAPVCYSAAGSATTVRSDVAIAQLTSIGYAGLMAGPPIIGFLSDQIGLRIALGMLPLVMLIAAILTMRLATPGRSSLAA